MDNFSSHSEHTDQPQEQQANILPPVPTSQVLDNNMIEQQHANLSPFGFSPEQPRMQLDQVLQHYNEQIRILQQQQQMAMQNATLVNLVTGDALIQKDREIASLHVELRRKQDDWNELFQFATMAYEMIDSRFRMVPPVQQETNLHVSSNGLDAPASGDEATSKVRTTAETTKTDFICEVCNSGHACMVFVPCKHFGTCKPCGVHLTACPVCGVKGEVTEPNSVEK